ncbi:MAG: hypothetical protein UV05_C0012G0015 [candidate division CPR1 bacterium GW2011_GWA2_42_17]|uniref:Uncharacterized protein n=1 Tax=candidate division CPR1 bacterium GW2011_GWA2_42_17 TaxID=1618341 RepID=A0A0G1BCL5_9BACT|nr:MAG: hypothetical protein UV05_C0012G0015 [candidate division CPR1 bacterium GW2011_GWA2_42_17]
MRLSNKQTGRQDFVDNKVHELINALLPKTKQINWDIDVIANIRDNIYKEISRKVKGMNERRFYP